MENIATCSFCGKNAKDVKKMFSVKEVAICSDCIETCGSVMEKREPQRREGEVSKRVAKA